MAMAMDTMRRALGLVLAIWLMALSQQAMSAPCTVTVPVTANTQKIYTFSAADNSACDPLLAGIAFDASGNGNFGASAYSTPTAQGGTFYIYNGNLPNGTNDNGFVYTPPAGFVGTDTATFFTSNDGGTWIPNGTVNFVIAAGPPTVTSISPTSGAVGTSVTITGTNFIGVSGVRFGATSASYVFNGSTSITATAPAGSAGTVDVTVTTGSGTSTTSAADQFTYVASPPVANPVSATVAYGSANNALTLNIGGGAPASVAVAISPTHGTAVASGTAITYTPTSGYAGPDSFTYFATNGAGTSAPATISVTVAPPTVTYAPPAPTGATVNVAYGFSLAGASGGTGPYTYTMQSGALPAGLTLSSGGVLSGTPTASGTFNFTVQATDRSTGTGPFSATSSTLSLTVGAPTLSLSPAGGTLSAAIGTAFNQLFTATGGVGPYTLAFTFTSGSIPNGLILNGNSISGTATSAGTVSFTVMAIDSSGGNGPYSVTQSYTLTAMAPTVTVAPATVTNPSVGIAYSQTMAANGGAGPYTYAVTAGGLPAGLTLSSGGTISGTPTAGGTYVFTITARDNNGFTGARAYTMTLGAPTIAIRPATWPAATVGAAYTQTVSASGGTGPYSFTVTSGTLPAGLTLSTAGAISGTPTAGGTYNFTVTATDSTGGAGPYVGSQAYSLTVGAATLTLTPSVLPAPTISTAYNSTFSASGGIAPYAFSLISGALPPGMTLNSATGTLAGTPTALGTYAFTVRATDSSTGTGAPYTVTRAYTLSIGQTIPTAPPVSLTVPSNAPVTIHAAANATGAPFSGVSITTPPTSGSAVINGLDIVYTPTVTTAGAVTFAYTLANSAGSSAPVLVTVNVNAVPVPVVQRQISTLANRPASVDVTEGATGGPFTGATVVSVTPSNAGSATVAATASKTPASAGKQPFAETGYTVTFTPAATYAGVAVVTYTLSNATATSSPAVIEVSVAARRDPSTDPDVSGLINAQIQAARRFATAQISNYNQRLEQLHGKGRAPSGNMITVQMPRTESDPQRCQSEPNLAARDACLRGMGVSGNASGMGRRTAVNSGGTRDTREAGIAAEAGAGDGAGGSDDASRTAPDLPNSGDRSLVEHDDTRLAFWTAGTVDFGFANTAAQRSGFRFTTGGVTAGADYRFSDELTLGVGVGYGRDSTDVGSAGTRSTADSYSFALYGSYRPRPSLFVDGVAGYGSLDFDSRRWVGDENAFAYGNRGGYQIFASVSSGYEYRDAAWLISPYGRLSVSESKLDRYSESGAGFSALTYFGQTVTTVSGTIGLRTEYAQSTRWGTFLPFARVEYQHDFNGQSAAGLAYADLAGAGPAYTVTGSPFGRDRIQVGLGGKLRMRTLTLGLDYNVMFGMGGLQQGVRLMFAAPF
ncbi:autotransporter domain-containing protein [Cupriavidus pauculus]|uniref:Autotransporter outer membrane beta-barrel domain-containing protein n=1 Tax=Cupriavidus pauculus TaxID=82633 RepID=A0A2N5CBC5_9BURK|nr:autotransporter domain-containing protein [Cupriavidus pauculus]PLP99496.1 autotransporter outer membrane beta-barrel domain-containing protein [Cupriavidus pauculus]